MIDGWWNEFAIEQIYDDVIKWKLFLRYWQIVRGIHRSPVNSPHKGQWRGALIFSLICTWLYGWINNREAGDLRRYRAHYDVIVMKCHRWTIGLLIDKYNIGSGNGLVPKISYCTVCIQQFILPIWQPVVFFANIYTHRKFALCTNNGTCMA